MASWHGRQLAVQACHSGWLRSARLSGLAFGQHIPNMPQAMEAQ
jgi:hypothetical protein